MSELFKEVEGERFKWIDFWFPTPEEHFRFDSLGIDVTRLMDRDEIIECILEEDGIVTIEEARLKIEERRVEEAVN